MTNDPDFFDALAEFDAAVDRGENPDRREFLANYPDLQDELRAHFERLDDLDRYFGRTRALFGMKRPRLKSGPFGRYEILNFIAGGGMGEVYMARDPGNKELVALKVMLDGPHATDEDIHRFKTEVRAVMGLDHPNIVPINSFDQCEGQLFLTMKLIEGGNLVEHLPRLQEAPREGVQHRSHQFLRPVRGTTLPHHEVNRRRKPR